MEKKDVLLGGGSPEEVLASVVRKYGDEIYLDSYRFMNMLSDLMGQEKKLLKVISRVLECGGGERVVKMSALSGQQLEIEKRKLVLYVAEESLIDEGLIEQGVCLLLAGIGVEVREAVAESETEIENNISDFVIENGVLKRYEGSDSEVMIPDGVTKIGSCAFYNCSGLERVVIPDRVIEIGGSAFYNCSSLKSVVIPDGVKRLEDYVFYRCSALERVVISEGVTRIWGRPFEGCSSLSDVVLKNPNVKISKVAFSSCPWQPSSNLELW